MACGNKDFGRPSGHLYGATSRLTLVFLMWFDETEAVGRQALKRVDTFYERWRQSKGLFGITMVAVICLLGILMISRMILGAHSLY